MDATLLRYIWRYSKRQQLVILFITFLSFPLLYYSLELPKIIVNDALQGTGFPRTVFGIQLDQVSYLLTLSFAFLALVIINNGIKYTLNVYKGLVGERMLRRLRYELYQRVLRFRLPRFRQVSQGEIIPIITSEVEPLGGFIGDAIALPALQGGTLVVYLYFIFMQDFFLGLAAIALYPVQMWIIPKLQSRVNKLARERVINIRRFADRIGESVSGIREIHANDTSAWHLADMSDRLQTNFDIRFRGFRLRFLIKFLNNFINQLTPFFFYSIGGYLVITGDLSLGALVAVLAAYKDLAGPWKELLAFYQERADVEIKYQTVTENFSPPDLIPLERLTDEAAGEPLSGEIRFQNVSSDGSGAELHNVEFSVPAGTSAILIGSETDGRSEALALLVRLSEPGSGRITIGGQDIANVAEATLGRSIAYVHSTAYVFNETIRGNVLYGLRHRPRIGGDSLPSEARQRLTEAQFTGNSPHLLSVPWEDPAEAGAEDREALDARALEILESVGMSDDVFRLGLCGRIDAEAEAAPIEELLTARRRVSERLAADPVAADLVEPWDIGQLNNSASLAENTLFALPTDPIIRQADLPRDPLVAEFLRQSGLEDELVQIGHDTAKAMIELFAQVSADSPTLGDFSLLSADELPVYEVLVRRMDAKGAGKLRPNEKAMLIALAMAVVPARHRLGVITPERETMIVEARPKFHALLAERGADSFVPFDVDVYTPPLSIEDNLIFGKLRLDRRDPQRRVDGIILEVIAELGLEPQIRRAGLDFPVGVGGSRLSSRQRERLALARAILRRTPITVVDGLFEGGGAEEKDLLRTVISACEGRTLIVGSGREEHGEGFDQALRLDGGYLQPPETRERPADKMEAAT